MNKVQNGVSAIFSLMLFIFIMEGCKENTILPSDLIPEIDNVNTFQTDTIRMLTNNVYQDSILTGGLLGSTRVSNASTFYHALGTITSDPIFGKTSASIHVEVLPPVSNFTFKTDYPGTNRTIDSVVLDLPLHSTYGDSNSALLQTFKVFRSLKAFPRDSSQFEFTKDSINISEIIASTQVDYSKLRFDTSYGSLTQTATLHFKLASWFQDSLEAQVELGANGAAADYSKYLEWWKGFYIMADSNNGNTLGFFDTYNTRLRIYYRYTDVNNKLDTVQDVFSFDPNYCNRFNTISRNYSGTITSNFVNSSNPVGDSVLFLQSDPGIAAQIYFPNLYNFKNVIVNKAEMVFCAVSPYYGWLDTVTYGITPRLQIIKTDNEGNDKVLEDYAVFGTNFVNGNRSMVNIGGLNVIQYKFGITQSIQQIITSKDSTFRFKIMGLNIGLPSAYRVLLRGSGSLSSELKPYLNLIYTKIDK